MSRRYGCRVYIGGLRSDTKIRDVQDFFRRYRRRFDVLLKERFAFIDFDDHRDADDAVRDLDGRKLLGARVAVEHARGPRRDHRLSDGRGQRRQWVGKYGAPTRTRHRIVVKNLSSRVLWQDLKDLMRRVGEVAYTNAHHERRNEAIVEFHSHEDVERALKKYNDYELHGRRLKLTKDLSSRSRSPPADDKERSPSRSSSVKSSRSSKSCSNSPEAKGKN